MTAADCPSRLVETTILPDINSPSALLLDGDTYYWADRLGGIVYREETPIAAGQETPISLVADEQTVYWLNKKAGKLMGLAK